MKQNLYELTKQFYMFYIFQQRLTLQWIVHSCDTFIHLTGIRILAGPHLVLPSKMFHDD